MAHPLPVAALYREQEALPSLALPAVSPVPSLPTKAPSKAGLTAAPQAHKEQVGVVQGLAGART